MCKDCEKHIKLAAQAISMIVEDVIDFCDELEVKYGVDCEERLEIVELLEKFYGRITRKS